MAAKEFYDRLAVEINDENDDFEFANRVVVAEHFLRLQGMAAQLTAKSTALTSEVANFDVHLNRKQRELKRLRRSLLARNYSRITKTAKDEVQDAFIIMLAEESNQLEEIHSLEQDIEELTQKIEARTPRLNEFKSDLKAVERTAEYCKQYLDYEKLEMRVNNNRPV
jgi:DNA repair exonuclease SbcCD ATPase subunit